MSSTGEDLQVTCENADLIVEMNNGLEGIKAALDILAEDRLAGISESNESQRNQVEVDVSMALRNIIDERSLSVAHVACLQCKGPKIDPSTGVTYCGREVPSDASVHIILRD